MNFKSTRPNFYFHITRAARDRYNFNDIFFSLQGRVIFTNYNTTHRFAALFNNDKPAADKVPAGHLNAMGLLDEVLHYIIEKFRTEINTKMLHDLENLLIGKLGNKEYEKLITQFVKLLPPPQVYTGEITEEKYLKSYSGDLPNTLVVLEEIMVLWLDNNNPAYKVISELIDDEKLKTKTIYKNLPEILDSFFKTQPFYGPDKLPLWEMLQQPAKRFPHSISAQLEYIRIHWADFIQDLLARLLLSLDFIREEEKMRFDAGKFGPGPTYITQFGPGDDFEPEAFSQDLYWMPRLVLIAKSTYVWLDQLSKKYKRDIHRLDQIPDEELERLSRYGFTGLWLIGLWERSKASRKIKQINGNPEAVASAYSLLNYDIAQDLGGDDAYQNLKDRARRYHIRLASDMVPNHMGIDSDWVINHPHWFIQSPYPPFPSYSFNGQDLSNDERVGLFIEDGYWSKSDAAVVFKRLDRYTGDVRYIYHGNDGTSMPWNDTAQLNYLMPEVREAVIQTILHVARKFPVIRFDAAMTLAKKHYQRLWFPEPGHGGDIPSRAEHALSKEKFNELFPVEFWREVVDRVQQEAPDTLLLAEAFWMMEGYFVRSLGMHRVYNSAFMNMLKMEENYKYRQSIKNILEYNPQILKRYVNFMNNPDEETAIAQFGKDDKYFGVCMMMCTMPGLPMFGHGQIEGFGEKYGMEYRRAYWDEQPDQWLISRHEREIFPILKKRYLFSDVENFYLFDFYSHGHVNENVFAYLNRHGNEKGLVLYHNKYADARGWINRSAAFKDGDKLKQVSLWEVLDIFPGANHFICYRDYIDGLEYIRSCKEISERGLYFELGAFKYKVLLDFYEVIDSDEYPWAKVAHELKGNGVPSLEFVMREIKYGSILHPYREAVNRGSLNWLASGYEKGKIRKEVKETFKQKADNLINAVIKFEKLKTDVLIKSDLQNVYKAILTLPNLNESGISGVKSLKKEITEFMTAFLKSEETTKLNRLEILIHILFTKILYELYVNHPDAHVQNYFIENRAFVTVIKEVLIQYLPDDYQGDVMNNLIQVLAGKCNLPDLTDDKLPFFENLFSDSAAQKFLMMNQFEEVIYFNKERFEELLDWCFIQYLILETDRAIKSGKLSSGKINNLWTMFKRLKNTAEISGYRYEDFMDKINKR